MATPADGIPRRDSQRPGMLIRPEVTAVLFALVSHPGAPHTAVSTISMRASRRTARETAIEARGWPNPGPGRTA
jgi:hypothetical protein